MNLMAIRVVAARNLTLDIVREVEEERLETTRVASRLERVAVRHPGLAFLELTGRVAQHVLPVLLLDLHVRRFGQVHQRGGSAKDDTCEVRVSFGGRGMKG